KPSTRTVPSRSRKLVSASTRRHAALGATTAAAECASLLSSSMSSRTASIPLNPRPTAARPSLNRAGPPSHRQPSARRSSAFSRTPLAGTQLPRRKTRADQEFLDQLSRLIQVTGLRRYARLTTEQVQNPERVLLHSRVVHAANPML